MNITIEQLSEKLLMSPEQLKDIVDRLENELNYEKSTELVAEVIKARPMTEDGKNKWTSVDRVAWLVRNAYIIGYTAAFHMCQLAMAMTIAELDESQADS